MSLLVEKSADASLPQGGNVTPAASGPAQTTASDALFTADQVVTALRKLKDSPALVAVFSAIDKAREAFQRGEDRGSSDPSTEFTTKLLARYSYEYGISIDEVIIHRELLKDLGLIELVGQKRNWRVLPAHAEIQKQVSEFASLNIVADPVQRLEGVVPSGSNGDDWLRLLGNSFIFGSACVPFTIQDFRGALGNAKRADASAYPSVEAGIIETTESGTTNLIASPLRLTSAAIELWKRRHVRQPAPSGLGSVLCPELAFIADRYGLRLPALDSSGIDLKSGTMSAQEPTVISPSGSIRTNQNHPRTAISPEVRARVGRFLAQFLKSENREIREHILRCCVETNDQTLTPSSIVNRAGHPISFAVLGKTIQDLVDHEVLHLPPSDIQHLKGNQWTLDPLWKQDLRTVLSVGSE